MAATLVPLHVAAHTERLPASNVRAFERLLARVRVNVNPEAARSAEGLVASGANIAILALR